MSYIMPIGVGISDYGAGYGGSAYGMSIYRKNAAQKPQETSPSGLRMFSDLRNGGTSNGKISKEADLKRRFDSYECQTCKNRKYQDGSDDSGVSFQTPTRVDPKAAASAVRSHEQEHVSRNRSKAEREGKEIVSQTVTIHTGICPSAAECTFREVLQERPHGTLPRLISSMWDFPTRQWIRAGSSTPPRDYTIILCSKAVSVIYGGCFFVEMHIFCIICTIQTICGVEFCGQNADFKKNA